MFVCFLLYKFEFYNMHTLTSEVFKPFRKEERNSILVNVYITHWIVGYIRQ